MGHMKKKKNKVIYPDSESESNASYEELQQALVDMLGDAMKSFEKLIPQKKVILKLKSSLHNLNDFKCLKDDHASLVNEKIVIPCIEPPKANPPSMIQIGWIFRVVKLVLVYIKRLNT